MEAAEYARMDATEDVMWWYRAAHAVLLDALRRAPGPAGSPVLDAGCGTGGLLRRLADLPTGRLHAGIDVHPPAARAARRKSGAAVAVASANQLPFADASVGVVFSVDVICHRRVDPLRALAEAHRCLQPGGTLIVNVPAFHWMMSFHDREVHNERRFERGELRGLLEQAGFVRSTIRYWNCLLFPLMVLRRKLLPAAGGGSDVAAFPGLADRLFGAVTALERAGARAGLRYPFGGSLLAVAFR
ncbi:MAG: class I SAM-dependent methyltransferase [Lautropia sp.]